MKKKVIGVPAVVNGKQVIVDSNGHDVSSLFRSIMIKHAHDNNEALVFDEETGRSISSSAQEHLSPWIS
jgi:hypothetical protein